MQLTKQKIKYIKKKYKELFDALETYDKTNEFSFQRKRIDLTLSVGTLNKLNQLKEKTGKPISRIIEEKFS